MCDFTTPLILTEPQNQANHEFMNRVINYSLSAHRKSPMGSMVAMGYFLASNAVSLTSLEYQFDPIICLLFQISKELTMKESDTKNIFLELTEPLLENIKRRIEDNVGKDYKIPGEAVKKLKAILVKALC
ncbi:hypothetical protein BDF21DRAFT_462368 [Thamnidium elegans]|uniref:Uncharacterized protein n=1 Tax=Thamnidium elegans TaxID=101142 RepID=A0A8H7VWY4_9FUNG|nr:hypothetical protein INT48_004836 [Thamnidium elegans]KAI8082294.1 hypothetical protein BDF21DRAFT_462368 [Thamnidium elegans]